MIHMSDDEILDLVDEDDPEEVIAQVAAGDRAKQNLVPTIRRTFL